MREKLKKLNPLIIVIIALVITTVILLSVAIALGIMNQNKDSKVIIHHLSPEKLVKEKEVTDNNKTEGVIRNVCETPECITLAHQLHNWRDNSIDPCNDFYKFSCGKYIEHSSSREILVFEKQKIVMEMMREFFWRNETSTSNYENSMRTIYQKCESIKDEKVFEIELQKTRLEILSDVHKIVPWPLPSTWKSAAFDLNEILVNMAKMGLTNYGLFQINWGSRVVLEPGGRLYLDSEVQTVFDILSAANIQFDEKEINRDLKAATDFSNEIFELSRLIDDSYLSFEALKSNVTTIDFDKILTTFIDSVGGNVEGVKKHLEVSNRPLFFGKDKNLDSLLKTTPPATIVNLIIFHYFHGMTDLLSLRIAQRQDCAKAVVQSLPQASLAHFVRNFFDRENVNLTSEMIDSLKETYIEGFRNSTWMNQKTKETAIKKVEAMTKMVAHSEEQKWEEEMEKAHQKLHFNPTDTLFSIVKQLIKFQIGNRLKGIVNSDKALLVSDVLSANAFYVPTRNHLGVLIALLDEPFFDSTFPTYARFSLVGFVLAHEIGHGFDSNGVLYDENAKIRNWWQVDDKKVYDKKIDCLIERYENYDDPDYGKTLNGTSVMHELAADKWGLEVTWKTHQKKKKAEDQDLIGFEGHDKDKMFFNIAALGFCAPPKNPRSLYPPEQHSHPTYSFRINGVFSNTKSFAETFKCPVGSPMNPAKKCEMF